MGILGTSKIAKLHALWWEFAAAVPCTVGKERTFCKYTYPPYNLCSAIFFGCVILNRCYIASNTRDYLVDIWRHAKSTS